jgi:hypothetical protein
MAFAPISSRYQNAHECQSRTGHRVGNCRSFVKHSRCSSSPPVLPHLHPQWQLGSHSKSTKRITVSASSNDGMGPEDVQKSSSNGNSSDASLSSDSSEIDGESLMKVLEAFKVIATEVSSKHDCWFYQSLNDSGKHIYFHSLNV